MAFSRPFWKKLKSIALMGSSGAAAFFGICIYQQNENFYRQTFMPLIHSLLDPEQSHKFALSSAKWGLLPHSKFRDSPVLESNVMGIKFKNPIGIAAGFDKDAEAANGLFKMGISFLEVGSVTPLPQDSNPKPVIFRLKEDEAIINRCGFNSKGHDYVKSRLEVFDKELGVLGVNLGKNRHSESEYDDYILGVREFGRIADYLVINVSSPNTPGLRSLQKRATLEVLLDKVIETRNSISNKMTIILLDPDKKGRQGLTPPILLKIAPDLSYDEKKDIAKAIQRKGKEIDGLIISNTTVSRPDNLASEERIESGGLSGRPLNTLSTQTIRDMYHLTQGKIPIIGVGGVSSGQDAYEKVRAGASLIQLYTALTYYGPPVISKIKKELETLILADGFSNISEAIGADHRKKSISRFVFK